MFYGGGGLLILIGIVLLILGHVLLGIIAIVLGLMAGGWGFYGTRRL